MATMNVSLPGEMVEFVEGEVAKGGYSSSSEVVRDALRLLQHDKALEQEKLAILQREVGIGLEAAAAGRVSHKTIRALIDEVLDENSAG